MTFIEVDNRARVHLVHFYSSPGGIEILSARITESFRDFDFRIFTIRPPVEGAVNVYEGSSVPRRSGARNNVVAWLRLHSYARQNRGDIFHLLNAGPYFLLAVRLAGVSRIVYSIRGTRYWTGPADRIIKKTAWKIATREKTVLVSNSEYSRQVFLDKINPGSEIRVLYNPVATERFSPPAERPGTGPKRIIYTGRLNRGKNLELWINVAREIHEKMPDTVFEIWGSGPLGEELRERIDRLDCGDYVFMKGFRLDIENVYRGADLFLFLSEYESFGNVVVESILCGTPVLASDIPSMREIFRDYSGFLVKPVEDVCRQVCDRLNDYGRLLALASKAEKEFRKRFSTEGHIEALRLIYNSLNEKQG